MTDFSELRKIQTACYQLENDIKRLNYYGNYSELTEAVNRLKSLIDSRIYEVNKKEIPVNGSVLFEGLLAAATVYSNLDGEISNVHEYVDSRRMLYGNVHRIRLIDNENEIVCSFDSVGDVCQKDFDDTYSRNVLDNSIFHDIDYISFKNAFTPLFEDHPRIREFFERLDFAIERKVPITSDLIRYEIFSTFTREYKIKRRMR